MRMIFRSTLIVFTLTFVSFNANAEVVNIGISTVGLYEPPTEIAKRKGFYQEEGLDVRKIVVRTPLHVAALLAGELDYSTVTGIIEIRLAREQLKVKEEVPESKVADWKFIKEVLAKR
jgi:ABC-type nitrate/sulfonate/bicarbonate transport system substrate-binding protein